jgi:integrase
VGVKIREWKGAWWLFINHNGQRKAKRVGVGDVGKKAARQAAGQIQARLALGEHGTLDNTAAVSLEQYTATWLERIQHTRKHSTYDDYQKILKRDVLPMLGSMKLAQISRDKVKDLAIAGLKKGQSPKTVQNVVRCLSSLLSHAVEDGLVTVNVALKPGKFLPKISKRTHINPYTREELAIFLATVQSHEARYYPLFLCAARTGLRQGELLALQWDSINLEGRFIDVQRNYSRGEICTPKSGECRRVDMSKELGHALKELHTELQSEAAVNRSKEMSKWVFCNEAGGILDPDNLRKRVFRGLLKASGLRRTRFHDLRHTFASLLLQQGESLVYVKEQMGHSSIQVTVDLYGHLIPGGNKRAVDRLDGHGVHSVSVNRSATPVQPWPLLRGGGATEVIDYLEPAIGIEPTTCGLRNRCSTN